jgi:hypothetical protein
MHAYLFPGLEAGPKAVRRLIRAVATSEMDRPTHPGRFTPREVVCHLADWEPISRGRMQTAAVSPGSTVLGIDEVERAREMGYSDWDPYEQAEEFIRRRTETVAFLKALPEEDWSKTAVHSERGAMTVYDYANMELGHDLYHLVQLAEVLERPGGRA